MTARPLRPRRFRYRSKDEPWLARISPTLPRRVLYGALFFYAAYGAHLAAFWGSDPDVDGPSPAAEALAASVAPIDSGVLEPLLLRIVPGSGVAPATSSVSTTTGTNGASLTTSTLAPSTSTFAPATSGSANAAPTSATPKSAPLPVTATSATGSGP